jgi:pyridoxal phosphate enzyme (YggS family)
LVDSAALRGRLARVRERVARAADRARRDPAAIRLVAVSKTFSIDHIRAAADAGHRDFGENKVQEAQQKIAAAADLAVRWHLVGHLQSNKARKAGASFHVVHSIDDVGVVSRLEEGARDAGRVVEVLVQVDLAREPTKHGVPRDRVRALVDALRPAAALRLSGLMVLPPAAADPEASRSYFAALRGLRDNLIAEGAAPAGFSELSMGMSQDFEVAIEEGATLVRVGSAIFGERTYV